MAVAPSIWWRRGKSRGFAKQFPTATSKRQEGPPEFTFPKRGRGQEKWSKVSRFRRFQFWCGPAPQTHAGGGSKVRLRATLSSCDLERSRPVCLRTGLRSRKTLRWHALRCCSREFSTTLQHVRGAPRHALGRAADIPLRGWRKCADIPHPLPTAAAPKECRRPALCRKESPAASQSP